ncbi:hypothetical protein OH804_28375 [Micromonospora sp. NBC_00860]|nr:hypothetical protein OH804_28375 [Micromonospora sp. NBC_00860]
MTTYGPAGSDQPDDQSQRPPSGPDSSPPVDPTLPQWSTPPTAEDPTRQQWGPPPTDAEPPTAPMWAPPPTDPEPPTTPMWAPPPTSGSGYPPPGPYPPAGPTPPSSGPGYPPAGPTPQSGPFPPPGPYPPAGPMPGQPAGPMPGQPPAPWGQQPPGGYGMPPVAPVKKTGRNVALIITVVVLLVLCPCLGLAGWAVWKVADAGSDAARTPSTSAPVVPPALASDAPTSAAPTPDEEFARGDCVVNDGSEDDAELRKVPCGPNTYQVLLRIPATTDGDRCETLAPQATANYVHDNSVDLFDYVLCLKKR